MSKESFELVLEELQKDQLSPEIIQDNKLHYRVGKDIYRARMPKPYEFDSAKTYKNRLYIKLLQDKQDLTIDNLKKLLKESQNIDIDKMQEEIDAYEAEMLQLYLSLAKKSDEDKNGINVLLEKIEEVKNKRLKIVLEKAQFLSPALEYQTQDEYYKYLTALCTEKFIEGTNENPETWVSVWTSFVEYKKDPSNLHYIALGKLTELVMSLVS